MSMNHERLAEILFDEHPRRPRLRERLKSLFSRKAIMPGKAPQNLFDAAAMMRREGLSADSVQQVMEVIDMIMPMAIQAYIGKMAMETGQPVIINNISFHPQHYLGVKIIDPHMDFSADRDFITNIRTDFLHLMKSVPLVMSERALSPRLAHA